jgi:esterase/lipase superfamily enzyme
MLRIVLTLGLAMLALLPPWASVQAKDVWSKVSKIEIDPRVAGSRTVELSGDQHRYKKIRLLSDMATVKFTDVAVKPADSDKVARSGAVTVTSTAPIEVFAAATEQRIASITLTWARNAEAAGPVNVQIEGLKPEEAAGGFGGAIGGSVGGVIGGSGPINSRTGATRSSPAPAPAPVAPAPSTAEKPAAPPPPPSTRGIGAAPSPAPAVPQAQGRAESEPAKKSATAEERPRAGDSPDTAASAPPRTRGLTGADRGAIGAAPPPGSPAPKPTGAPPAVIASAPIPADGPAVPCVQQGKCTAVEVFFGTDRNQTQGPQRISFGAERPNRLALGAATVTVPKVNRERGTIARPWQERYLGLTVAGDPAVHFTIPKNGVKVYGSEAEFLAEAKRHIANAGTFKDHAFIYVHGFAVTFENALYRAAQMSYDLSTDGQPFGTAFVYSWPSKGSVLPTAYLSDQDSADQAAPHLRKFIELVTEKTGVANVHIIAHSMGNRVLMRTMEQIALSGSKAKINQIILAAPDVDKQQFETVAQGVGRLAKGFTLYASKSDNALVLSRQLRGGFPRAGEVNDPPGPAIVAGFDTIDISALSTSIFDFGHDKYADSTELLADIGAIFTKGLRPPQLRNARFKLLQQGTLQYWRYVR